MAVKRTWARMQIARTVVLVAFVNLVALALYLAFTYPVSGGVFLKKPLLPYYNAQLFVLWACLSVVLTGWALYEGSKNAGIFFEGHIYAQFEGVCHAVGMYRQRQEADKNGVYYTVYQYPQLRRLCGDADYFEAEIQTIVGHTVKDYQKATAKFALAFEVCSLRFEQGKDGKLKLYACKDGAVNFPLYEPKAEELLRLDVANYQTANPGDSEARALLWACPIGVKEDGSVYKIPLESSHLLIAGSSRAGKGSYIWSIVMGLAPAVAAGCVRLWGFDPKGIELAIAPNWWHEYADSPEGLIELIEKAESEMREHASKLKGLARKFTPSPETPLNLLVIDELGYFAALMPDRKLQARGDRALQSILVLGAAVGFCVVGAIQDPRKETLPYRDLFTRRVALRLPPDMIDLVLGKEARIQGAACDQIPQNETGRGVAFANSDEDPTFTRVRAYYHTDSQLREWSNFVKYAKAGRSVVTEGSYYEVVEDEAV